MKSAPDLLQWRNWIGLPHEMEADPREGRAACCVRIAQILRKTAELASPEIDPKWFEHARLGHWSYCRACFDDLVTPAPEQDLWSLAFVNNGPTQFGVGIVVQDRKLLLPHHRRGVMAIPLSLLKPLSYFHIKE